MIQCCYIQTRNGKQRLKYKRYNNKKEKKKKELLILYTNWYLIKYRWNGEEEKAKEEGK